MTKVVMRDTEAAEYLGVCRATVWNLVARDAFPRVFVGGCTRFRRVDIDAYLERQSATVQQASARRPGRRGQSVVAVGTSRNGNQATSTGDVDAQL